MKCCVGIDLGSTTTKAIVLGEAGRILGRGITNSRSNYQVACQVAVGEAMIDARFALLAEALDALGLESDQKAKRLAELERLFSSEQYRAQLGHLHGIVSELLERSEAPRELNDAVGVILANMEREVPDLFAPGVERKSDFFRDLAGSRYLEAAEGVARNEGIAYDKLASLFDKSILEVENSSDEEGFENRMRAAMKRLPEQDSELSETLSGIIALPLEITQSVGTGYGRATLPFPKEQIRSEILCHGLGAHKMFPDTRTVLDIGGQDTKAIQVDEDGIVTSFQMNDRCAAGCGRYLGYIADEMNLGLHQLGPMACKSKRPVKINSTCTVFAGAELRERLSLGEKREDILAGLHRAIILRAMSLLSRSGGVKDQFTFTGGVAKNPAATAALIKLVEENFGERKINISADSIYTGALGAAIFSHREWMRRCA